VGHVKTRNAYKIMVGSHQGNRALGGHKFTWEDNIKMKLKRNILWR
jgi:hypothetical protein